MYRLLVGALLTVLALFIFLPDANAKVKTNFANTKTEFHTVGRGASSNKHHVLRYYEEGLWVVEELLEQPTHWLERVSKTTFTSEATAKAAELRLQKNLASAVSEFSIAPAEATLPQLPSEVTGEVIWPTTQSWSWEWEQKYAQWLTENMDTEFYVRNNVATDCADVAYSARWIFARIHGLPAANRLGSDVLFTNASLKKEWASLPTDKEWSKDRRFLAALNYVLNFTYTHTLMRDSYPVAINPDNFLPGIHALNLRSASGHTQLVHRVNSHDETAIPFLIIQSTIPREVRVLGEDLYWHPEIPEKDKGGFLRIRWPRIVSETYELVASTGMPGYSLEQYQPDFIREKNRPMNIEVMLRLNPKVNFLRIFESGLKSLKDSLEARVKIVEEGYQNCKDGQCPLGSAGYENWSTPSRDKKIGEVFQQLQTLSRIQDENNLSFRYFQALQKPIIKLDNEEFTMMAMQFIWTQKMFSSEPDAEPSLRWAAAPAAYAKALQNTVRPMLEERTQKISAEQDLLLKSAVDRARYYCNSFTADQCERYQAELDHPVSFIGQTHSFRDWMELISWFNSDPRQTPEIQWGGFRKKVMAQTLTFGEKFTVSKNGFAAYQPREKEMRVGPMTLEGVKNTALPEGFQWRAYDKEASTGYAFAPGRLLRQNFVTGTRREVAVPLQTVDNVQVVLLSEKRLLWLSKKEAAVLDLKNDDEVAIDWRVNFDQDPLLQMGTKLVAKIQGAWNYIDFSTATPQRTVTKDVGAGAVVGQTKKFWIIYQFGEFHKINRATGENTEMQYLNQGNYLALKDFSKVFINKLDNGKLKTFVLSLDENLNLLNEEIIGEPRLFYSGMMIVSTSEGLKLYDLRGETLQVSSLLPDEEQIAQLSGSWAAFTLKNKTVRLRSVDGQRVLYEGPPAYFLEGPLGAVPSYIALRPFHAEGRVLSLHDLNAPALMTGYLWNMSNMFSYTTGEQLLDVDRGVFVSGSTGTFWVDL